MIKCLHVFKVSRYFVAPQVVDGVLS